MSSVLRHVSYTLGTDSDLEHERRSIAVRALMYAGATPEELGDMHSGLTVIDGKVTRILAVYVANPKVERAPPAQGQDRIKIVQAGERLTAGDVADAREKLPAGAMLAKTPDGQYGRGVAYHAAEDAFYLHYVAGHASLPDVHH